MNLFEMNILKTIRYLLKTYPTLLTNTKLAPTEAMYYLCYWNLTNKFNPAIVKYNDENYYVLVSRDDVIDITGFDFLDLSTAHTIPFPTQTPSKDAMKLINIVLTM